MLLTQGGSSRPTHFLAKFWFSFQHTLTLHQQVHQKNLFFLPPVTCLWGIVCSSMQSYFLRQRQSSIQPEIILSHAIQNDHRAIFCRSRYGNFCCRFPRLHGWTQVPFSKVLGLECCALLNIFCVPWNSSIFTNAKTYQIWKHLGFDTARSSMNSSSYWISS